MRRLLPVLFVVGFAVGAAGALWYYRNTHVKPLFVTAEAEPRENWLDRLCSPNPRVVAEGEAEVTQLGAAALPEIRATLTDPNARPERKKAVLRACTLLGPAAAPALPEVTAHLATPEYTAAAALALSMMGPDAYTPLADALTNQDPQVRREAVRSLGKLQQRAPLEAAVVVPTLLDALADREPGVRSIAATYLGIIHADAEAVVPALVEMLKDEDAEVRTAAVAALGEFGTAAAPALAALRRAQGDKDENVAREAGVAVVRLQGK